MGNGSLGLERELPALSFKVNIIGEKAGSLSFVSESHESGRKTWWRLPLMRLRALAHQSRAVGFGSNDVDLKGSELGCSVSRLKLRPM